MKMGAFFVLDFAGIAGTVRAFDKLTKGESQVTTVAVFYVIIITVNVAFKN